MIWGYHHFRKHPNVENMLSSHLHSWKTLIFTDSIILLSGKKCWWITWNLSSYTSMSSCLPHKTPHFSLNSTTPPPKTPQTKTNHTKISQNNETTPRFSETIRMSFIFSARFFETFPGKSVVTPFWYPPALEANANKAVQSRAVRRTKVKAWQLT